jgi:hypothetical protein
MRPSARGRVFRHFISFAVAVVLGLGYTTAGAVPPSGPVTVVPPTLARSHNAALVHSEDKSRDKRALGFVLAIAGQLRSGSR